MSTTTVTPAPTQGGATTAGNILLTAILSGAVIAAAVSAWVNYFLARRAARLEERSRVRTTLAEAYQAYADYKEFPYAIRRRSEADPAGERIRLSEEIRQVQSRLSFYLAWTRVEDERVGQTYSELVEHLRKIAGTSMHEAWAEQVRDRDSAMNIDRETVNLDALEPVEKNFLDAATRHIGAIARPWSNRHRRSSSTPETPS